MTSLWCDGAGRVTVQWRTPTSGLVAEHVTYDLAAGLRVMRSWDAADLRCPSVAAKQGEG